MQEEGGGHKFHPQNPTSFYFQFLFLMFMQRIPAALCPAPSSLVPAGFEGEAAAFEGL